MNQSHTERERVQKYFKKQRKERRKKDSCHLYLRMENAQEIM
jgi:hypothetical protein